MPPATLVIEGTHTNVGTTEETTIQFPKPDGVTARPEVWYLVAFRYVRTAGTAANMRVSIAEKAGHTRGDIDTVADLGAVAVGTGYNTLFAGIGYPVKTDASGRLYFKPAFDAGSDNIGKWKAIFRRD